MLTFLIATLCAGTVGQMGTVCEDVIVSSSEFDPYLNMVSCQINGQSLTIAYRNSSGKYRDYQIVKYTCVKGQRKGLS